MADNKFVTLEALKSTAARLQQEWLKSISKAGHATFRKAEAIPTVDEAQDNVMYLVMNDKTQHYDIYAKVEGAVVLLDDTTVDLFRLCHQGTAGSCFWWSGWHGIRRDQS